MLTSYKSPFISTILLLIAGESLAQNIAIDFTATVKETTCAMTFIGISGGTFRDEGANTYTLTLPEIGLDKIVNKTPDTEADFKLQPTNCSGTINSLQMKISGNRSAYTNVMIAPTSNHSDDSSYVGAGFRRSKATTFFVINDENVVWSRDEITNGLPLTVALRETLLNKSKPGQFEAKATFTFTYQ